MAGYKETPRQKMIGMMYLVLTALLALNVSKQIMDAFLVVNESMETTNVNFSKKLDDVYSKFKKQYALNPNKVGPYWHNAEKAHQLSMSLENYVDSIKYVVIQRTEKLETIDEAKKKALRDMKRKDNYDTPTRFFIGSSENGSTSGEARILKEKIENYKKQMIELVDAKNRGNIKIGMDTQGPFKDADGKEQNWQMHNFYRTILAATVTILNKIKADIYNLEFDVVNNLYASVSEEDWKFDEIRAKVIPKSEYVFVGEHYQAEIIVAAYDSKQNPKVRYIFGSDTLTDANIGNATPLEGENGIVMLDLPASGEGLKKFAGVIQVISPSGITKDFHFHDDFIVAKRAISISPTQMLVFYRGVPNPVKITVPGGASDIQPTITYGAIARSDTNWIVSVPPTGGPNNNRVILSVSAVYEGKRITLGSETFRLKSIPDPDVSIAGQADGPIAKNLIIANPVLMAIPPPGFDLNAKFTVLSYTFATTKPDGSYSEIQGTGRALNAEVLRAISTARKRQKIWIDNIKVQGPDGTRKISRSTSYTLQ
jgi:gliding motility-associated protein GldM